MPYQFRPDLAPGDETRRIATEQIDRAIAELDHESADVAIHQFRKRCKKLRALFRTLRAFDADLYRRENRRFRDLAREHAEARDAAARIETIEHLIAQNPGNNPPKALRKAHAALEGKLAALHDADDSVRDRLRATQKQLERARHDTAAWKLTGLEWKHLIKAVTRTYRQGRDAWQAVLDTPTDEQLHEWRKQVKYLGYQSQMIGALWTAQFDAMGGTLDELADALGDIHDAAVLMQQLSRDDHGLTARDLQAIGKRCERWRTERIEITARLGGLIYAETPKAFRARLDGYAEANAASPDR